MSDVRAIKSRRARIAAYKQDWHAKLNYLYELEARDKANLPVGNNTYSSTLITDFLVDTAVTILVARFAPLRAFMIQFQPQRMREYATADIKFVTTGGSTLRGTKTNTIVQQGGFEQGDANIVPITVPVTHYVKSFNVSQEDLMFGLHIENLMQMNLLQFSKDVTIDALSPIAAGATSTQIPGPLNSSGNVVAFSAGTAHVNSGTFGWNLGSVTDGHDLANFWKYLKNSPEKNLILDGNFFGRLTNSPGYFQAPDYDEDGGGGSLSNSMNFGWDRIVENTAWPTVTDAASNAIGGFACNRTAIGGVVGLPSNVPNIPGGTLTETIVQVPGLDISVSFFLWFNLQNRKYWNSFELMGGWAGMDASAGAVIFNGSGSVS